MIMEIIMPILRKDDEARNGIPFLNLLFLNNKAVHKNCKVHEKIAVITRGSV